MKRSSYKPNTSTDTSGRVSSQQTEYKLNSKVEEGEGEDGGEDEEPEDLNETAKPKVDGHIVKLLLTKKSVYRRAKEVLQYVDAEDSE